MSIHMTLIWSDERRERATLTTTEFEQLINEGRTDARGNSVVRVELCLSDQPRSQGKGTEQ